MEFKVRAKIRNNNIILRAIKILLTLVLLLVVMPGSILGITTISAAIIEAGNSFFIVSPFIVCFISIVLWAFILKRLFSGKESTFYVGSYGIVDLKYKGKTYKLNIESECIKNNVKLKHYTYTDRAELYIKNINHKYISIIGTEKFVDYIYYVGSNYNIRVIQIDDEPNDD